jgi:catalase-peroxidase
LFDMNIVWSNCELEGTLEGRDRRSGIMRWSASHVDLLFGSNIELRAIAEVYASNDSRSKFIKDFGRAWSKVMNLGLAS